MGLQGRSIGVGLALIGALALAPATASAAGLLAAYEQYVPGQGFQIGLVNAATGAAVGLPQGVNTTDEELHPTLSPDGRYLVFERFPGFVPTLNGDFPPPSNRSILMADRTSGTVTVVSEAAGGSGPVFGAANVLGWGIPAHQDTQGRTEYLTTATFSVGALSSIRPEISQELGVPSGQVLATTHAETGSIPEFNDFADEIRGRPAHYLGLAFSDTSKWSLRKAVVRVSNETKNYNGFQSSPKRRTIGTAESPAGHPDARPDDYFAYHQGAGNSADIMAGTFPGDDAAPAPAPINTTAPEHDPAWSPDSLRLGFVRTTSGHRRLAVYDATPGIQAILNPLADLGATAPTPQTRSFQEAWGGLSLSDGAPGPAPFVTCDARCRTQLGNASGLQTLPLTPTLSTGSTVGIFVVRVVGKRKLLGRSAPRVRVVGRVPLGRAHKGHNRFRWNGKVNGKRLRRGTYLLTYRALKGKRITSTSGSIRFTVTRDGKVRRVRRER